MTGQIERIRHPQRTGSCLSGASSNRPTARSLFASGYLDEVVLRRANNDGGYAFLQKPFRPEALALKVREVLDDEESSQGI